MKEAEVKDLITFERKDIDMSEEELKEFNKRIIGVITHVNERGFVFINSKDKPFTRIFAHWQSFHHTVEFTSLKTGTKVSFELRQNDDKSWRAIKVDLV